MTDFGRETTAAEVLQGVDLTGTMAVVTGASAGLGRAVAQSLRDSGAQVIAAVRRPERVAADGPAVDLDLASLASVRSAAKRIADEHPQVDLLFNNAGVMATPGDPTTDGFEPQLGTNHLGHFLLTGLLADRLAPGARVINTSSMGHMISGIRWDDPHFRASSYDKWQAYGQSKTANILFTIGLASRGVTAYAVHPGAIATDLARHLDGDELAFFEEASQGEAKTIEQGAATLLWAATTAGVPSGSYVADCRIGEALDHATDPAEAERLWSWSEAEVDHCWRRPTHRS